MRRAFFLGVTAAAILVVYACSFPEVTFDENRSDTGVPDVGTDTTLPSEGGPIRDGSADARDAAADGDAADPVYIDAAIFDSTAAIPDATRIDAAACTSCDCDNDTYESDKPGCGGSLTRVDCDDSDPRTHPLAGPYAIDAEAPRNGDWNCDGTTTPIIPENFKCQSSVALLTECAALGGFTTAVPCGHEGDFVTCREPSLLEGLNCLPATTTKQRQLCQ